MSTNQIRTIGPERLLVSAAWCVSLGALSRPRPVGTLPPAGRGAFDSHDVRSACYESEPGSPKYTGRERAKSGEVQSSRASHFVRSA